MSKTVTMRDNRVTRLRLTPLNVGPIPPTWEVAPIGKVAHKVTNGFVGKCLEHQVDRPGVLYLQGYNVRPSRIETVDRTYVSSEFHRLHMKSALKSGDVLVVQSGHIGTCARVPDDFPETNCHALIIVDPKRDRLLPDFLVEYLNSSIGQRRLKGLHVGSSVLHINTSELAKYRIPLPTLDEQRKITEVLRAWHEANDKVEALSAVNQNRYAAVARRFFDPCHPSFIGRSKSWQEFKLGDMFRERAQQGVVDDVLLSITMSKGVIDRDGVGRRDSSSEDKSHYKLILPGDIGYNTMRMWQGVSGLSRIRGIVSPAYTVITPDNQKISSRYAAHLFKSRRMVHDFERYSQGLTSDTWNLKFPAFSKINVFLPPVEQQEQQASLLDAMHEEDSSLKRQSEVLTAQKRGLVQKLLTGDWRVKV